MRPLTLSLTIWYHLWNIIILLYGYLIIILYCIVKNSYPYIFLFPFIPIFDISMPILHSAYYGAVNICYVLLILMLLNVLIHRIIYSICFLLCFILDFIHASMEIMTYLLLFFMCYDHILLSLFLLLLLYLSYAISVFIALIFVRFYLLFIFISMHNILG